MVLVISDLDLMGLRNIFVPVAKDIEAFAAADRAPDSVIVRRIAVTPDQVLDHLATSLRISGAPGGCESWWPVDRNGDAWQLPTSEALLDVVIAHVRECLESLLPDVAQRDAMIASEADLKVETVTELRRFLDEANDDGEDL